MILPDEIIDHIISFTNESKFIILFKDYLSKGVILKLSKTITVNIVYF